MLFGAIDRGRAPQLGNGSLAAGEGLLHFSSEAAARRAQGSLADRCTHLAFSADIESEYSGGLGTGEEPALGALCEKLLPNLPPVGGDGSRSTPIEIRQGDSSKERGGFIEQRCRDRQQAGIY